MTDDELRAKIQALIDDEATIDLQDRIDGLIDEYWIAFDKKIEEPGS